MSLAFPVYCYISVNLVYIPVRSLPSAGGKFVLASFRKTETTKQTVKPEAMKTKKNSNRSLPSPAIFSICLLAVAVFCFLNWTALKAADPLNGKANTLEERLAEALEPAEEPALVLEDWMLTVPAGQFADNAESEVAFEDWMVSTTSWTTSGFLAKQ